jgi:outer membrane protein W
MKKLIQRSGFAFLFFLGLGVISTQAQFQVGLGGNYFLPTAEGSRFSDGYPGGGLTLRYFISPQLAVGINGRFLTKKLADVGGFSGFEVKAQSIAPGLQAEFFLTKSAIKPYVGIEGNYFMTKTNGSYQGEEYNYTDNSFGVAPKLGTQFMFSPTFGLDVNAGYHFLLKDKDSEPEQAIMLGAGLVFKFGE